MVEVVKTCSKCGVDKEATSKEFHCLPRCSDGLDYYCKFCRSDLAMKRYHSSKNESIRMSNRNRQYGYRYGIDKGVKDDLFLWQNNKCACCGSTDPKSKKGWMLDHDHATGRVRGVVCHSCNCIFGAAGDSTDRLQMAITFLKITSATQDITI